MNDLGLTLLSCAAQVTALALAGAALAALAARRGPSAGAAVAFAGLAACVALTVAAFCPLPAWWAWPDAPPRDTDTAPRKSLPVPEQPTAAREASAGGLDVTSVASALRQAWRRVEESAAPAPGVFGRWPGSLAVMLLAGASLALARLLLGLWAVARCRRRSRPVADENLVGLLNDLCSRMECPRPVEARVTGDVTSPATLGWRSPLILLPDDWRSWDAADLRAVLAHEVAHVRRADYPAWLVARLGVALHFYNPLVRWLAGRLHLQQELAADALGARFAGGRGPYLRALARLALRQDDRPATGPARAFLSAGGTLRRRIQMLKTKNQALERPLTWRARLLALGVLAAVGLGASALRGPAQAPKPSGADERFFAGGFQSLRGFALRGAGQELRVEAEPTPFNLTYVSDTKAQGVYGIRPAAIFGRPGMKKYVESVDGAFAELFKQTTPKAPPPLTAAEIEEIVGLVFIRTDKTKEEGQSSLQMSLNVIRTVKEIDWKKRLVPFFPNAKEIAHNGKTYYKLSLREAPFVLAFAQPPDLGGDIACYFPDKRTLVLDSEANVRRRLSGEKVVAPARPWAADWKAVERGLFAVAFDASDKKWLHDRKQPETAMPAALVAAVEGTTSLVCGLSDEQGLRLTAVARCNSGAEGEKVHRLAKKALADGAAAVKKMAPAERNAAGDDLLFLDLLTWDWTIRRDGARVEWRAQGKGGLKEMIERLVPTGAEE